MTAEEYRALLDVDFNNVKIEDLTDIRKIKIDKNTEHCLILILVMSRLMKCPIWHLIMLI